MRQSITAASACICLLASCNSRGIEGKWVKLEVANKQGASSGMGEYVGATAESMLPDTLEFSFGRLKSGKETLAKYKAGADSVALDVNGDTQQCAYTIAGDTLKIDLIAAGFPTIYKRL